MTGQNELLNYFAAGAPQMLNLVNSQNNRQGSTLRFYK